MDQKKQRLTKTFVDGLVLPESGQVFVWDAELRGFGIRLTPTAKTYICQGRVNGRNRRVSLGRHGVITLLSARRKAQTVLAGFLDGVDPSEVKKKDKALSMTLSGLVDLYIKEKPDLKFNTTRDIRKHLKKNFSDWAGKPIVEITRDKVLGRFREITDRGSVAQANQAFRILRALLNFAKATQRIDGKPMLLENAVDILSDAKVWNRVPPRSGRIPMNQIGAVWNFIDEQRRKPEQTMISRSLADLTAFLLLTGARLAEATTLTWEHVNLDEKWWFLPDPKNRNPVKFPLAKQLVEILMDRPRINEYVFPSRSRAGHISDARGLTRKTSKLIGAPVTPHDLRRTFRAVAGECGIEFYRCKLLLNHRMSGDVTINSYTETSDLRYLSKEIQMVADYVTSHGKVAAADNVIQLRRIM